MSSKKGFTLIELALVAVIIGILVALAIPRFINTGARVKQSEARQMLKQIYLGQEGYHRRFSCYFGGGSEQNAVVADRNSRNNFADIEVEIGSAATYSYKIVSDDKDRFKAVASANIDGDDALDVWSINQAGVLTHDLDDIKY